MQDFEDVTLNTEISKGLNILLKRDATTATTFSSQTDYPEIPFQNMWFDHAGKNVVFKYDDGNWIKLWDYESGAPYNLKTLSYNFQPKNTNLTNFSFTQAVEGTAFGYPLNFDLFSVASSSEMRSFLELKRMSAKDTVNGRIDIDAVSIPESKFNFDFETDIPRVMKTGDIKRSFSTEYDDDKWVVMDGNSLGSSVSNARYKGTKYKKLFALIAGENWKTMWESGQTVNLPSTSDKTFTYGDVTNILNYKHHYGKAIRRKGDGSNSQLIFTAKKDGTVYFELVGAGGVAGHWRLRRGRGKYSTATASGGGGAILSGYLKVKKGSIYAFTTGNTDGYDSQGLSDGVQTQGHAGEPSCIYEDNVLIVSAGGGKGGYCNWGNGARIGGAGGTIEKAENIEHISYQGNGFTGSVARNDARDDNNPYCSSYGATAGWLTGRNGDSFGEGVGLNKNRNDYDYYSGHSNTTHAFDESVGTGENIAAGDHGYLVRQPPQYRGYAEVDDQFGVTENTLHVPMTYCLFLIRL